MKLLSISTLFVLGLAFAACQQDPQSATSVMRPDPAGGGSTPAHPAIAYTYVASSHGVTYQTVGVMDSDGSHATNIYTAPTSSAIINLRPSWSPNGGSIAFFQHDPNNTGNNGIYLRDVSLVSGVPTGSNTRRIYSYTTDVPNTGVSYCSVGATASIALSTRAAGTNGVNKIMVVSTGGGTPTVLYQSDPNASRIYKWPTWSPDDSKIAFVDRAGANNVHAFDTIRVIDASTGQELQSIGLPYSLYATEVIEWSRSGADILALSVRDTNAWSGPTGDRYKIYYLNPSAGSTPTSNGVTGAGVSWSPNNSSILTCYPSTTTYGSDSVRKVQSFGSNVSRVGQAGPGYYGTWRR